MPEPLDLDRDLPTTPADVEALRRLRPSILTIEAYLEFLRSLGSAPPAVLRARRLPVGAPPFTL